MRRNTASLGTSFRSATRQRAAMQYPSETPPPLPSENRSEEHTSELQSPCNLVCRLLLEKKKKKKKLQHSKTNHHTCTTTPNKPDRTIYTANNKCYSHPESPQSNQSTFLTTAHSTSLPHTTTM